MHCVRKNRLIGEVNVVMSHHAMERFIQRDMSNLDMRIRVAKGDIVEISVDELLEYYKKVYDILSNVQMKVKKERREKHKEGLTYCVFFRDRERKLSFIGKIYNNTVVIKTVTRLGVNRRTKHFFNKEKPILVVDENGNKKTIKEYFMGKEGKKYC